MIRRFPRAIWPFALLIVVLSCKSNGCRRKPAASAGPPPGSKPYRVTVLMTPPPPQPTVTMWKGATRVPQLPE